MFTKFFTRQKTLKKIGWIISEKMYSSTLLVQGHYPAILNGIEEQKLDLFEGAVAKLPKHKLKRFIHKHTLPL